MSKERTVEQELDRLAYHLLREQNAILARWRRRIEAQDGTSTLAKLSMAEFTDHIPEILDRFSHGLRGESGSDSRQLAERHGAHRWQHGTDLAEIVNEWRLLHETLADEVRQCAAGLDLGRTSLHVAYWRLAEQIHQGIEYSIKEFESRQRLTADARVRELEAVSERRETQERERGQQLREASHDLRGSLQIVRMSSEALKRHKLDPRAAEIVARIDTATENLHRLLNDLLDFARLEAGREQRQVTDFDAAALLRDLAEGLRPLAQARQLELRITGPSGLTVRGDASKVRRIAQNLTLNALKYTHAGHVEVGWKRESNDRWLFYVADTGPGLADSAAKPLARSLKDASDNTSSPHLGDLDDTDGSAGPAQRRAEVAEVDSFSEGIGLLIVHQLCKMLDAILEVESEAGRGTLFRVVLPSDYPQDR